MSATEVVMPLMGEGVNEATITSWLIKEGDFIEKDAPILEVSTDKVDTEIMAPASGYLAKVLAKVGDTVQVDQVLAKITSSEEGHREEPSSPGPKETSNGMAPATPSTSAQTQPLSEQAHVATVKSSPLVRKMAQEFGIDLRQVEGTGLHGRITKQDILSFKQTKPAENAASAVAEPRARAVPASSLQPEHDWQSHLPTTVGEGGEERLDGVLVERQPMNRMRQLIARHMVESVRTSPHVTTVVEIDMHRVVAAREQFKEAFQSQEGFKLTYTPFLLHAAAEAIKAHPIVNTSLDGSDVLYKKDINLGCAVAINGGLIVPVIKQAGEKNLLGIARALNDLVSRARSKKLRPEDVQGGTFSITNPGGFGSLTSNPIINQPQVAILGIGAIVKRPVVIDDMIGIRPQMLASLTFDHRVIDGEGGAQYLASFKEILENYDKSPL